MTAPPTTDVPIGWGDDSLSSFLNDATRNQLATFANLQGSYRRLLDIDYLYQHLASNLDKPPDWIAAARVVLRCVIAVTPLGVITTVDLGLPGPPSYH